LESVLRGNRDCGLRPQSPLDTFGGVAALENWRLLVAGSCRSRRSYIPVIELAKVNLKAKPFRLPQPLAHACKSWWY